MEESPFNKISCGKFHLKRNPAQIKIEVSVCLGKVKFLRFFLFFFISYFMSRDVSNVPG